MKRIRVKCTPCGKAAAALYDCDDCGAAVQACFKCAKEPCPFCARDARAAAMETE